MRCIFFFTFLIICIEGVGQDVADLPFRMDGRDAPRLAYLPVPFQVPIFVEPNDVGNNYMMGGASSIDVLDVFVTNPSNYSQTENSVFIHPSDRNRVLNANNTAANPWSTTGFGVSGFVSSNYGQTWSGTLHLTNSNADPAVVISKATGRYFINFINNSGNGQSIAYSDNFGASWNYYTVVSGPPTRDKNHLWVDNRSHKLDGSSNPNYGNLYIAWFQIEDGGACSHASSNDDQAMFTRSTDNGANWSTPLNISAGVNAVCQNQGVNIQTGPNGEVYACWAVYDVWAGDEVAIGFNKSLNGGVTWGTASRTQNIRGHRITPLGGQKTMRHNSFPSMAVNQQNGNIYIVWTNRGVPGGSAGDPDIYMIKSVDGGNNWSSPIRVNQDALGNGKDQWFPWIACDEISGALVVTYYDSRDFTNNDEANTYISLSYDDGVTWEDHLISDVSWSGDGIPNAQGYAGDYIGIDISNGYVVPVWSDDRNGNMLAYTQPFIIPCLDDDLVLCNGTITGTQDYKFYNTITIGGTGCTFTITNSGKSNMQANTEILYKDGVTVQGELHAQIVACDNSGFGFAKRETDIVNKIDYSTDYLSSSFQYKVYPNPSNNGNFQLEVVNKQNYPIGFSLVSILGETIYQSQLIDSYHTIDISHYPKGIYLAKMTSGGKVFTYKIVYQ